MAAITFEWDEAKASANLEKHDVSFDEAKEVFDDPNALEGYDAEHSTDEDRFFIIGLSNRRLLFVVFAERHENTVRIISARKAVRRDEEEYEQESTNR